MVSEETVVDSPTIGDTTDEDDDDISVDESVTGFNLDSWVEPVPDDTNGAVEARNGVAETEAPVTVVAAPLVTVTSVGEIDDNEVKNGALEVLAVVGSPVDDVGGPDVVGVLMAELDEEDVAEESEAETGGPDVVPVNGMVGPDVVAVVMKGLDGGNADDSAELDNVSTEVIEGDCDEAAWLTRLVPEADTFDELEVLLVGDEDGKIVSIDGVLVTEDGAPLEDVPDTGLDVDSTLWLVSVEVVIVIGVRVVEDDMEDALAERLAVDSNDVTDGATEEDDAGAGDTVSVYVDEGAGAVDEVAVLGPEDD